MPNWKSFPERVRRIGRTTYRSSALARYPCGYAVFGSSPPGPVDGSRAGMSLAPWDMLKPARSTSISLDAVCVPFATEPYTRASETRSASGSSACRIGWTIATVLSTRPRSSSNTGDTAVFHRNADRRAISPILAEEGQNSRQPPPRWQQNASLRPVKQARTEHRDTLPTTQLEGLFPLFSCELHPQFPPARASSRIHSRNAATLDWSADFSG